MLQEEEWSTDTSRDGTSPTNFHLLEDPLKLEKDDIGQDDEGMRKLEKISQERSFKRKHSLTISDKITLLKKLENGVTPGDIARQYGISTAAVSRTKKKKMDYLSKATNEISMEQKNLRITQNRAFDDITYAWLCQQIYLGEPINGPILCEKALVLNEKINGPSTFKASNGWLYRFKRRHGIKHLTSQNEKVTADEASLNQFVRGLNKFIGFHAYEYVNIYNTDETGLNWKSLPAKKNASENEICKATEKERITVGLCANATGTHRIPALVIGDQEKYKCFGDVACLPIVYKSQANSLMDRALFIDWYTNDFIPAVKLEQEKTGNRGKVLLLLDNAPCHSSAPVLNSIDEHFSVMYLPPDVTVALQPMNQGIIKSIKYHYRKTLTIRLLLSNDVRADDFIENLTIKDCCEMIACSWQSLSSPILSKTWQSLWTDENIAREQDSPPPNPVLPTELASSFNQLEDFQLTESDVEAWLNEDSGDHGWAALTDEQLIAEAIGPETFNVNVDIKCENYDEIIQEQDEQYSAQDALSAIDIVYKWYEKQHTCILEDLEILNKIRNTAMAKVLSDK